MHFERNDLSLIEKKVRSAVQPPKRGTVTRVYEHTNISDDSNHEVNVSTNGGTVPSEKRVPVISPSNDTITIPKVGDKVIVFYENGDSGSPFVYGNSWSNEDRAPLGRAGMYRNRFESGESSLGNGDLHLTGYTAYENPPVEKDKDSAEVGDPQETFIQVTKHQEKDNVDPSQPQKDNLPFKFEIYDSPKDNEGHLSVEINGVNGNPTDDTWGMKFDFKTGEFKFSDPNGFGVSSNGYGDLTLQFKEIAFDWEILSDKGDMWV